MSAKANQSPINAVAGDISSELGRIQFLIKTALSGIRTSMPVKVVSVENSGGLSPIGYLDVQPLVNLVDANGIASEHGIIYNVPYMRIQGGNNAVIIDPVVGDIGIATVCDRDISTVKNTGGDISAPGSNRKCDMSDMVYLMTIIGSAPTQYLQFNSEGINIFSPTKIKLEAPIVQIDASTSCSINSAAIVLNGPISQTAGSGNAIFAGSITTPSTVEASDVIGGGISLKTHKHGGVQTGGGQTGSPV